MAIEVSPSQEEQINRQVVHLSEWLARNAPHVVDEQCHLDAGTEEQAYWHYGYLVALRDIQKMIHEGDTVG